jgi:tyrosine-protein kinase Etk/Wzc
MNNNSSQQFINNQTHSEAEETVDMVKYLNLFKQHWYWFILVVMVALSTAYFINHYTQKTYKVVATILIDDEGKSQSFGESLSGNANIMNGFSLFPSHKNLQNQLLILKSSTQIEKTIRALNYEVSYYVEELFGTQEVLNAPFVIIPDKKKPVPLHVKFRVTIQADSSFTVTYPKDMETIKFYNYLTGVKKEVTCNIGMDKTIRYGDTIDGDEFSFLVLPSKNGLWEDTEKEYSFSFNSYEQLANYYEKMLEVELLHKEASMLTISLPSVIPDKAMNFLNMHIELYMQRSLDKKNNMADNAISFIDQQLGLISESLYTTKIELQDFKKKNKIIDLGFQAQQLSQRIEELDKQREEINMRQNYLHYLREYLNSNMEAGDLVAPSIIGIDDPLINSLVLGLNDLYDQKIAMGGESSNNPYISTIDSQIRNFKTTIIENTGSMINNNINVLQDINNRFSRIMGDAVALPETELRLFEIERLYNLNDYTYAYLLEQKYMAEITKASNTTDNEIIDVAKVMVPYISPRPKMNYILALILGMFIPGGVILLKDYFNNKINTVEDIKELTNLPIAGTILHSESNDLLTISKLAISNDYGNIFSESFRSLRSRLNFISKDAKSKSFLITSSISGEGKTFVAINLAVAYSLVGKKTLLVGYDLRNPSIGQRFDIHGKSGLTNFLIGKSNVSEIIHESGIKNLWVIPSGEVPPNPSELADSERNSELFSELKTKFDYIIIDSPPIGLVSDALSLVKFSDNVFLLARSKKTNKKNLKEVIENLSANGLTNMSIIMNDLSKDKTLYGYKGSYYGYGYGYGYRKRGAGK